MNIFEVLTESFKPFMDDKKRPLNVLEVGNLWEYLAGIYSIIRDEEVAFNMTEHEELKKWINDAKENLHMPIAKEIEKLFIAEGVPLPLLTPEKPAFNHDFRIPEGVRISDYELANLVSLNLVLGITYASRGLTESIRADVGLIYGKAIFRKMMFATTLKPLMDKNGWLKVPPYYHP